MIDTPAAILIVSELRIFKYKSTLYNEVDEGSLKNRNSTNKYFQSHRIPYGSTKIKIWRNVLFLLVTESRVALWSFRHKLFLLFGVVLLVREAKTSSLSVAKTKKAE